VVMRPARLEPAGFEPQARGRVTEKCCGKPLPEGKCPGGNCPLFSGPRRGTRKGMVRPAGLKPLSPDRVGPPPSGLASSRRSGSPTGTPFPLPGLLAGPLVILR
jgi:hypothetical protein